MAGSSCILPLWAPNKMAEVVAVDTGIVRGCGKLGKAEWTWYRSFRSRLLAYTCALRPEESPSDFDPLQQDLGRRQFGLWVHVADANPLLRQLAPVSRRPD